VELLRLLRTGLCTPKKNDALFPSEIKKLEEFADYFYLINQRYVKMDNFDLKEK